ncbi:MAG: hypothetical protein Q8K75_06225 [Chlamydiales bacterium]|nr:hypothetical protein [Chlamydiales bacterium]
MLRLFCYLSGILLISALPQEAHAALKRWNRAGLDQYTKQVARERGWTLVGEGWMRDGDIEEIAVTYKSHQRMQIPDARRVIVEEVQKAVPMIQAKQKPKTLENIGRPFTYESFSYMLSFYDKRNENYSSPYLDSAALVCGYVVYWSEGKKIHEETFEEALRIVEAESRG